MVGSNGKFPYGEAYVVPPTVIYPLPPKTYPTFAVTKASFRPLT